MPVSAALPNETLHNALQRSGRQQGVYLWPFGNQRLPIIALNQELADNLQQSPGQFGK